MLNVHHEESEQVHGCLRRDAAAHRRLMVSAAKFSTLITQQEVNIYVYEEKSDQGYDRTGPDACSHR